MTNSLLKTQGWEQVAREAEFSSSRMASLCSVSERQLQRIFKRHLHCTPSRWLRDLQCRLAKDLIAQGYSTKAAAAELKFSSESHFCREFKKVFGHPPQSFSPNHLNVLGIPVAGTVADLHSNGASEKAGRGRKRAIAPLGKTGLSAQSGLGHAPRPSALR